MPKTHSTTHAPNVPAAPKQDKAQEAEPMARRAVEIAAARMGPGHTDTGTYRMQLGACLVSLGRYDEAEKELLEANKILQPYLSKGNKNSMATVRHLMKLYDAWGKPDRAKEFAVLLPATQPIAARP